MVVVKRKVGSSAVNPVGLGCMSIGAVYGRPQPDEAHAEALLNRALDLGYDFLDTASVYGDGYSETMIGKALKGRRGEFVLASKCGFRPTPENPRTLDGSPAWIAQTIDVSLRRLQTDHIDLYYLHRPDPRTPIEESVGALADAVKAGKIGAIGLSEVSADQLRRGHATHPIAALQTEYSLWTRNPEIAGLDTCRALGVTFVAFSPVARGFLAGAITPGQSFSGQDMRASMPRFHEPNLSRNLALLGEYRAIAADIGCTPAQLALAWLLHRDPDLVTIPGTQDPAHLAENIGANDVVLSDDQAAALDALLNQRSVAGSRYGTFMQSTVTTEEYA